MTITCSTPSSTSSSTTLTRDLPCSTDSDLWFAEHPGPLAIAQARCGACPLQVACLDGALERGEPWGVWGGRILIDGQVVATKRGRGRPRRVDVAPAALDLAS